MYVLITAVVEGGLIINDVFGPFTAKAQAQEYAEKTVKNGVWFVRRLETPVEGKTNV